MPMRKYLLCVLLYIILLFIPTQHAYQLFDFPEIKVKDWIGSSVLEENAVWEPAEFIPRDEFRVIERGSTFVVSEHIAGLSIVCNASYPVEWDYDNAEHAMEDVYNIIMKTFRESNNVNDPRHDRFIATLEILSDSSRATGNYTCRSVTDHMISKSVYIFWEGSSPPFQVLAGETVLVQSEDNQTVVLPCYLNQPDAEVRLYREVSAKYELVPIGAGVKYNSKVGFTLDITKFNSTNLYTHYRCVIDEDDEADVVNVIVQSGSRPKQGFPNIIERGAGISYDAEKEEIVCCAKGNRPPSMHSIFCATQIACRMLEHKLLKPGNNGKKSTRGNCIVEKVYTRDHGRLRCKGDGIDVFRPIFTDFGKMDNASMGLYFDWNRIVPERMMHITLHPFKPPFYHKQGIAVSCDVMNSYFSDGHKWAIRWKNGSLTEFKPVEYVDDPVIHGFRSAEITLDFRMTEIICYAPVWNSTQWVSKSVKLTVRKSFPPVIDGTLHEELHMALNETEKLLECKSSASPPASIAWTKNGETVPSKMVIWKENGTSILMFHVVGHDTQAAYQCTATNYAGSAKKEFQVFVEDSTSSAWGTAATVIVPILVIAFLGTAGFLVWKMKIQKKVLDHLSRVVFRDVDRQS